METALADGWFRTLPEAIDANDKPKAVLVEVTPAGVKQTELPDDAAPTRAELEQQAKELSIKFDGRTTDAALLRRINDALAA